MNAFKMSTKQKLTLGCTWLISAVVLFFIMGATFGPGDMSVNTAGKIVAFVAAILIGANVRAGFIFAGRFVTGSKLAVTGARRMGLVWRAVVCFLLSKVLGFAFVVAFVAVMGDSGAGLGILLAYLSIVAIALYWGLRYGQSQAVADATSSIAVDTQAGTQTTANAPVDTQTSNQTAPNIAVDTQPNGQVAAHSSVNTQTSSPAAATNAVGTQTNTRNSTSPSAGAQVGDSNTKDGVFGKGKWGLWAGAGLVVLYLGFLGINYAKQSAPKDAADIAAEKGVHDALYGDNSLQSATPPPAPIAAPAPPSAPVAAVASESPAAAPSPTFVAEFNGGEWNSSYTQGVQEYIYRQKDGLELVIDCGSDNPGISTSLTINGQQIGSQGISGSNDAFGMIIGDHTYANPFDTSSEVNGGANFAYFWDHLRVAKSVVLVVNNTQYSIPTDGLDKLMPVSSDQTLQCKPEI